MTAVNGEEFNEEKLGRQLARSLEVTHRVVKRGRAMRKDMEDMDNKRWIRRATAGPKSAIKAGK